jgi:RNA polymerase sigma-70 factor (ECF subfamily)
VTDTELVLAARANDAQAWQVLTRRYLPVVWRQAYALLDDVHATEDVSGEVMLAFFKGIDEIDAQATRISAWLRSVVRHKVADHHRRAYRAQGRLPELVTEYGRRDDVPQPDHRIEVAETRGSVVAILEKLPERHRLALEWKYVEGLRVKEIADRWGETEKTVEAILYRARREFRRSYEFAERASVQLPSAEPMPVDVLRSDKSPE